MGTVGFKMWEREIRRAPYKQSLNESTDMLMSFSVSPEDRTRIVYATACKGSVDYEGQISR